MDFISYSGGFKLKRKYPGSMFIMGIVLGLLKKWYILLLVILLFIVRVFAPDIPSFLPFVILAVYLIWAIVTQLKYRSTILNMKPGDNMLDKMFANNDSGYRNVIDTVNEIIEKQTGDRSKTENEIDHVGTYDFNKDFMLVEMIINEYPDKIDIGAFCVPDEKSNKLSWQVAYMEQYLNIDGTYKLCETYSVPTEQSKPSRVAFFIFKTENKILSTPYGEYSLVNLQVLPDRLERIIDFCEVD
jgi:hypothetical protein